MKVVGCIDYPLLSMLVLGLLYPGFPDMTTRDQYIIYAISSGLHNKNIDSTKWSIDDKE